MGPRHKYRAITTSAITSNSVTVSDSRPQTCECVVMPCTHGQANLNVAVVVVVLFLMGLVSDDCNVAESWMTDESPRGKSNRLPLNKAIAKMLLNGAL